MFKRRFGNGPRDNAAEMSILVEGYLTSFFDAHIYTKPCFSKFAFRLLTWVVHFGLPLVQVMPVLTFHNIPWTLLFAKCQQGVADAYKLI